MTATRLRIVALEQGKSVHHQPTFLFAFFLSVPRSFSGALCCLDWHQRFVGAARLYIYLPTRLGSSAFILVVVCVIACFTCPITSSSFIIYSN